MRPEGLRASGMHPSERFLGHRHAGGLAEQDRAPPRIRLRPARPTNPTLTYTIPHALTHLLQVPLRLVPGGERSCDLFAMARAGDRFLVPPGYVRVPPAARL